MIPKVFLLSSIMIDLITGELAIWRGNFYTAPLAGEITHVQCAEETPKKNAQAQVQEAAPASKV